MQFEHEGLEDEEAAKQEEKLRKRTISFGFSAILDNLVGNERSHLGYAKLEPEEPRIKRDRVRLC